MSIITRALIVPQRHPDGGDSWGRDGVSHQKGLLRDVLVSAGSWEQHLRVGCRAGSTRLVLQPRVKPCLFHVQPSPLSSCSSDSPPLCAAPTPPHEPSCNRAGGCPTSQPLPETIAAQSESAALCLPGTGLPKTLTWFPLPSLSFHCEEPNGLGVQCSATG